MAVNKYNAVKGCYEDIKPLALADQPISIDRFDISPRKWTGLMTHLKKAGAVEKQGRKIPDREGATQDYQVQEYRIKDWCVEYVKELDKKKSTLPCGHRGHIHNVGGRLDCRYCDKKRDFKRETVVEALNER